MTPLHLEVIFDKPSKVCRKEFFLLKDEMFNTYRYISFWHPVDDLEEAVEDVILREQYPNTYLAIKGLRNIKYIKHIRKMTDDKFYELEDFIAKEIGEENFV